MNRAQGWALCGNRRRGARMEWALLRHTEVVGKRGWGITVPSRERTQAPGLPAKVTDWQVHSGSGASSYAPVNPVGFGLPPGGASEPRGLRQTRGVAPGPGASLSPGNLSGRRPVAPAADEKPRVVQQRFRSSQADPDQCEEPGLDNSITSVPRGCAHHPVVIQRQVSSLAGGNPVPFCPGFKWQTRRRTFTRLTGMGGEVLMVSTHSHYLSPQDAPGGRVQAGNRLWAEGPWGVALRSSWVLRWEPREVGQPGPGGRPGPRGLPCLPCPDRYTTLAFWPVPSVGGPMDDL